MHNREMGKIVRPAVHRVERLASTAVNNQKSSTANFLHANAMRRSETEEIGNSSSSDTLTTHEQQAIKRENTNNNSLKPKETSRSLVQNTIEKQGVNNLVHQIDGVSSPGMLKCIEMAHIKMFNKSLKDTFNVVREFSTSSRTLSDIKFPEGVDSSSNEVTGQGEKNLVHEQDQQNPIIPNKVAFKKCVSQCGEAFYSSDKSLEGERLEVAWTMYQQGLKGSELGFAIIGRQPLREVNQETGEETVLPSDENYPSLDREVGKTFGFMNQSENGSLLRVKDVNSLVMNDAWMLGTIQRPWALKQDDASGKSVASSDGSTEDLKVDLSPHKSPKDFVKFHLGSPLRWENLWNEQGDGGRGRMTILAREVIQLVESGYEIKRENPKLEPVAVCVDPEKARTVSLLQFKESVERYWKKEDLREFFESLPEEARE